MKKLLTFFTAFLLFGSMMVVHADYYVAGTMNSWNAGHSDYKMSGSDPYSVTKQLNTGAYQFKITQGSWGWSTNSYDQSASNVELSIEEGNIAFSLSTNSEVTFSYNASTGNAYVQATPVTVPSYTFTSGTTIYYDFRTYGAGVNLFNSLWNNEWKSDVSSIILCTLTSNWEVTASSNLFKSNASGWSIVTCSTLPEEGQNMLVSTDGSTYHWDTYSGETPDPTPATIKLHGNFFGEWNTTSAFTLAGNEETASLTLTDIAKGNYQFGVRIGSDDNWTSNGSAFSRANPSHAIASGSGNCTFNADRNGDYTFTWTYATNTLAVTYPAVPAQSVTFNSLASEILKGSVINLANCVTSSGIDDPTYRFYIKEKNGSYGDVINANYTFNANGEYVVKVEALEYGEPVAYDESAVVVYQSYTFTSGTTIYVDFSAMTEGGKGVNYPSTDAAYAGSYDAAGAGTVKTVTFSTNVTWTTNDVFIKTEKAGWDPGLKFTVPEAGENCAVVAADGASYTWTTYVAPPPTIKMHGDFLGSWANTDAFVLASNNETASLTLNIQTKGEKEFGVRIGSDDNWTSNGATISRASSSAEIISGSGNCKLDVDAKGDYTFTWTFASNTLAVTYPALPAQSVAFDGLAAQVLKGSNVVFAATSSGIDNPGFRFYVKEKGGSYGSAVASYTFDALGEFVVKVEALEDNAGDPVVSDEADVIVYDARTFTNGTTIYVDFSAMTEGAKGVNYPYANTKSELDYDANGAGTIKTIVFSADVEWTTNDVFIKTEKASWAGLKFIVPGAGENCAVVAADGASYTWTSYTPAPSTVVAKGDWDSWDDELAFTLDEGGLSASATKNLTAGNYAFKVIIGGEYRSNNYTYHRGYNGAANITGNEDNMILQADADGDYIFTWTFATNAIQITFPAAPIVVETAEVKFFPPRTEAHQWEHVYAYQWKLDGMDAIPVSEAWPGDEITSNKEGVWYKCTVDKGTHIIFSDGEGMQTYDIDNVQEDVCYVSNRIDEPADPADPIKVAFEAQCTVDYYITGDEGIAGAGNAWNAQVPALKLDGSNQITLSSLPAGRIYEFKITNGSWAWSLGGKEHLNTACSNGAATTGSGNVKFKLEDEQDVTISYNPTTQKICLDATTVLPFENVRTGLTPDNYYTICNSREMKQIRGASLWSFASKDASFAYLVREDAPFAAGKPFIVWAESDKVEAILDGSTEDAGSNGALHGTFLLMEQGALDVAATNAGHDLYLVIGNALHRATGNDLDGITPLTGNSLPAYRAYVVVDEIPNTGAPAGLPKHRVRAMPMQTNVATGIDALNASEKPVKVMIDGQLFILRGEKLYDATGRLVK